MESVRLLWVDLCSQPSRHELFELVPATYEAIRIHRFEDVYGAVENFLPAFACIEFDYPDNARLQIVPLLKRDFPALPLIMFTEYHSERLAVWAFRSGVWDYRVKPVDADTLIRSIEIVARIGKLQLLDTVRGRWLPPDLIAPAGHLQRPAATSLKTGAAVAHIAGHFDEPLGRGVLARLCHLSPSEFSRDFRREQGTTYSRFLMAFRIAKAREFLAEPHSTIAQTAYATGFNDAAYFSRVFRRLVGITASDYQQRLRPLVVPAGKPRWATQNSPAVAQNSASRAHGSRCTLVP